MVTKALSLLGLRDTPDASSSSQEEVVYGRPLLSQFLIDPAYRNLNHGSFGTIPRAVQSALRGYQDAAEARPDQFIRYDYPVLLDESRAAVAGLLRVDVGTVVFVPNATVGVNTVLKTLAWHPDGRDEILTFSTVYGACGNTVDYVVDAAADDGRRRLSSRSIPLAYPLEDDEVVRRFREAVRAARAEGRRPRVCLFDVVTSMPGVRFPFEAMTAACRELGVLSLVDGAQGIGMVDLDLAAVDPDFFVSNCHKWLHVPRGCAVFYVPLRNQHLIRSTLATSHGYVSPDPASARTNPLPPGDEAKSAFVTQFEFVGTLDNGPYLCVKDAIRWRAKVLGGEDRIIDYQRRLAREGGKRVAEMLGSEVLENKAGTLTGHAMVNVALPLVIASEDDDGTATVKAEAGAGKQQDIRIPRQKAFQFTNWLLNVMKQDYKTFMALCVHEDRWWVRLSAQVYLDMDDFEWAGATLRELCERAAALDVSSL